MHSERKPAFPLTILSIALAASSLAGCGNNYRPVVTSINPVGPAGQPQKFAVAISGNGTAANPLPGLVSIIDFSGDTILNTTLLGVNPQYLVLDTTGFEGYTLNGDGTLNSFGVTTSLLAPNVLQSTLLPGSNPVSILPQGSYLYIAQTGRNSVAQLEGLPPAIRSELPTGAGTTYTVGVASAPRVYALVQGASTTGAGTAAAIETGTNTISSTIPVGVNPTYGVMSADGRRAYILNKGSNTVSVINAQANALDTFHSGSTITSTIPVGIAPVWADFAPTLNELVIANQGSGLTAGSVTIVSIPLCSQLSVTTNPNCDTANPIDATGFGTVIATVPVGINPVMVGVLQDGTQAYIANAGNAAAGIAGSVSVLSLTTNTIIATIPANNSTVQTDAFIHGHPTYIGVTTGTPTGKVYVVSSDSTDISIIRTDNDTIQTHLPLQGNGISVRMTTQ